MVACVRMCWCGYINTLHFPIKQLGVCAHPVSSVRCPVRMSNIRYEYEQTSPTTCYGGKGRGVTRWSGSTSAGPRRNDQSLGFALEFARRSQSHGRQLPHPEAAKHVIGCVARPARLCRDHPSLNVRVLFATPRAKTFAS